MFSNNLKISNLNISKHSKALIIAEVGINHEGKFSKCIQMIDQAVSSGADMIKLQIVNPQDNYEKNTLSYKIFKKSLLTDEEIYNIYKYCKKKNIKIFSTFDKKNFQFYKKLKQVCFKISSSQFYDYFFIKEVLKENKPVIISTGVADIKDIDVMINLIKKDYNKNVAILHCTSLYPTINSNLNLKRIAYLKDKYKIITGFSDHSIGIDASVAAIHYGAKVIEKHFTLNSKKQGFDHKISLEPKEFKKMVDQIRKNEQMIGTHDYKIFEKTKKFYKISSVIRRYQVLKDVQKNSLIKKEDIRLLRTKNIKDISKFEKIILKILNKKTSKFIKAKSFLKVDNFEDWMIKVLVFFDLNKTSGYGHLYRFQKFKKIFPKDSNFYTVNSKFDSFIQRNKEFFDYGFIDSYNIN